MNNSNLIHVTQPALPPLDEFIPYLEDIWKRKWLTNNGHYHQLLEKALGDYLGVKHISLFTNGTLPLITALQALRITGEVITTPYSFVATSHALLWNGINPVFVDIDPQTGNLDPNIIEAAITSQTTAIMPVHVYGTPCDTEKIQAIADKYGLKIIYDAAHAFGVKVNGESILNAGDMSTLSFHATKVYTTFEGGALICHDEATKKHIDQLKNFGFVDEVTVVLPGINAKVDEMRAAYGLLGLKYVDENIVKRANIAHLYRQNLSKIEGISLMPVNSDVQYVHGYFPIFVDEQKYGLSRDALYEKLKENNIFGRRYFYPLISDFPTYSGLPSASKDNLPNATKMASGVICLPIHPELAECEIEKVINIIHNSK
jgi:dTDP-4-amino-4,6-dideoxygalactose transaminase